MSDSYTRTQKVLHWLVAIALLFWLFVSGELVEEAEGEDKVFILAFHASGALIILALMFWRLGLRREHPVAPMAGLRPWEATWSRGIHSLFYGLVFLMVASGLLQGMYFEQDVRLFGLLDITGRHDEARMAPFHEAHEIIATLLKVFIGLHVLAALKHQFIDRRPVLRRMI